MSTPTKIQSLLQPATKSAAAPAVTPGGTTKTASENSLSAALDRALSSTKVASAAPASPTEDLRKMAAEIEAAEYEQLKTAAMIAGKAFADRATAGLQDVKVASVAYDGLEAYSKYASETPELASAAYNYGYETMKIALEKQAAADYNDGYNQAMADTHQAAVAEFAKAAAVTDMLIDAAAAQQA